MSLNKVILLGRIGRIADLKYLENGTGVLSFSMAMNERWKDKEGNKQEKTNWVNVTVWGKQAETVAQYFKKGSEILVEGKISSRTYGEGDEKKYVTDVTMSNFSFTGVKKVDDGAPESSSKPEDDAPAPKDEDDDLPF